MKWLICWELGSAAQLTLVNVPRRVYEVFVLARLNEVLDVRPR